MLLDTAGLPFAAASRVFLFDAITVFYNARDDGSGEDAIRHPNESTRDEAWKAQGTIDTFCTAVLLVVRAVSIPKEHCGIVRWRTWLIGAEWLHNGVTHCTKVNGLPKYASWYNEQPTSSL